MNCPYCGGEISELATVCIHCGKNPVVKEQEKPSALWWWLGFFIPIAGFIVGAIIHKDSPINAKKAIWGGLWGIITSVVLSVLAWVLYYVIFALAFFTLYSFT